MADTKAAHPIHTRTTVLVQQELCVVFRKGQDSHEKHGLKALRTTPILTAGPPESGKGSF